MANLTDADKVLRNDVGKSIVSKLDDIADAIVQHGGGAESLGQLSDVDIDTTTLAEGQSIVYNETTQKFENGEVSTVAALDDLTDVSITSAQHGDSLRNDGNGNWINEPTTVAMTQDDWDDIQDKASWRNAHKNTHLVITDAPNLNATAQDISYDGGADTVKDKIDNATDYKSIYNQTTYQNDIGTAITTLSDNISNFRFLRVIVYISSISSSSRGIALVANLKQAFGANYIPICINGTQGYIRIETTAGKSFTLLALSSTLGNSCCVGEVIGIY